MLDDAQDQRFLDKQASIKREIERLNETKVPASEEVKSVLAKYGEGIERGMKLAELLKRPNIDYKILQELNEETKELNLSRDVYEQVEIMIKYDGYLNLINTRFRMILIIWQ